MADKKLIAKLMRNKEDKSSMKLITEEGSYICYYTGSIQTILAGEMDEMTEELIKIDLSKLESLLKLGFTIRLGKVDETFTLIISKGNCSVTYTATKDNLIKTLQEAEEWAEAFVDELQITNQHYKRRSYV